jgi:hypothetical protein
MQSRPTSLTVVCWILIVSGPLALASLFTGHMHDSNVAELMSKSALPISVQYAMMWLGALITSGSGIMMLYGQNWARLLYMGWAIFGIMIGLITFPFKIMLLPSIVGYGIIAFFLFRPATNAYFSGVENRLC